MWGTQNLKLLQSAKEIWDHLLQCRITVTVECLPSELKVTADWEPRNNSDSSEWNLALQLSQRICQLRGTPEKDLFASHQIRTISSDQGLLFVETRSIKPSSRCLPTKLVPQKSLCFSPFCMIPKFWGTSSKRVPMMIFATPAWPSQLWYSEAMGMSIQQPIFLTWRRDLLKRPKGEIHPLAQNKTLKLVAWTEFQGRLPVLSLNQEDQVLPQIMAWSKWPSWCAEGKIDQFCSNINQVLEFLSQLFQNGIPYRTINSYRSVISAFHDHAEWKPVG